MIRNLPLPVLLMAAFSVAAPARAAPATARLVRCGAGDCLLVRGHRPSARAGVQINGRPVTATGGTRWRVELPVETVRDWSALYARTLHVAIAGPDGEIDTETGAGATVRLPVGMLARNIELASLVVRAR